MGSRLKQWKYSVVATHPQGPIVVAAGCVVARLLVYEVAILLPMTAWATMISLPQISILIMALATMTLNILAGSADAAKILKTFERHQDHSLFQRFENRQIYNAWRHRVLDQLVLSLKISFCIALPITLVVCMLNPAGITLTVLFHLPALILSVTAIMLSPMPLGTTSPHWFPVTVQLFTCHLFKPLMSLCVETMRWEAIMQNPRWSSAARVLWIVGRATAALVWQLPSLVTFHIAVGWLWPSNTGASVSVGFMILGGLLTTLVASSAAIRDWRSIGSAMYQREASIHSNGIMEDMFATFDYPSIPRTRSNTHALFTLQLIPIIVGLIVGRVTLSLSVAMLFIAFIAYSLMHAMAWSNECLTVVIPTVPVIKETVDRRPPDKIVNPVVWRTEADARTISEDVKRRADLGLEED